jgi:hypothetical protein
MGVYLCIGQPIHLFTHADAVKLSDLKTFENIQTYLNENGGKIFLFMGEGTHKIKRKAEQYACMTIVSQI